MLTKYIWKIFKMYNNNNVSAHILLMEFIAYINVNRNFILKI